MKRIGAISLLVLLLLQAGGMLFVYKVQQWRVQQQMCEALEDDGAHFQKIVLPIAEYSHLKINSREIAVNKKMYDVKAVHLFGQSVELIVMNDTAEENILKQIKDFACGTHQDTTSLPRHLELLMSLRYLSTLDTTILSDFSDDILIFPTITLNLCIHFADISTPPPQTV